MDDTDFISYFGNFRKGAALPLVPGDGTIGKAGLLVLRPHAQSTNPSIAADGMAASTFSAGTGSMNNAAGTSAKEMLTHLFVQRAMPKVPLWFHEGFAAYVSTSEVRGGNGQTFACFGFPLQGQAMVPVASLWDATFDDYAKPSYRGWFQATAMTLIDFIMHGDGNKHRAAMGTMVNELAAGTPSVQVVTAAFGGADTKAIDEQLQVHRQNVSQIAASNASSVESSSATNDSQNVSRIGPSSAPVRGQCPFGVLIPPEIAPDETPPKISPVPAAQMEALFRALKALPARDEYPPYYPPEILANVKVPAKS